MFAKLVVALRLELVVSPKIVQTSAEAVSNSRFKIRMLFEMDKTLQRHGCRTISRIEN